MNAEQQTSTDTLPSEAQPSVSPTENLSHLDEQRPSEEAAKIQDINHQINNLEQSLERIQESLNTNRASLEAAIENSEQRDDQLDTQLGKALALINGLEKSQESLVRKAALMGIEIQKLSASLTQEIETAESELRKTIALNSRASEERDSELTHRTELLAEQDLKLSKRMDSKLTQVNGEIKQQGAQIASLHSQSSDLDKRASELEKTAKNLSERTNLLEATSKSLQIHTNDLIASVTKLNTQTEELYERTERNQQSILALAGIEKRHFYTLGLGLLLLAAIIGGLSYYENSLWETQATADQTQNRAVDGQISQLQNQLEQQSDKANTLKSENLQMTQSIQALEQEINTLNADLQNVNEQTKTIERKIETVDDSVQTIDAQLAILAPSITFGKDNTLHGQAWLARQPQEHYAIKLATLSNKNDLYRTAQRYSYYFKQELSYFATQENGYQKYVLVYGNFTDKKQASTAHSRLPRYIGNQRPSVQKMGQLQQFMKG